MGNEEVEQRNEAILRHLRKMTEELTSGPDAREKSRRYLISLGIYNEDGTLHKDYEERTQQ